MTEVSVTEWANYEGDLPERYPHRQPRNSGRGTEPIAGPDLRAYRQEKRRRLKARSPTLTVTKVEPSKHPLVVEITFDNGMKVGHAKSKNAKVGDKFVVASQRGKFPFIMDAEEGNAPIQDPMEFGEMANWTPLDGSEGLKRKRAEAIQVESVAAEEDIRMIYVSTREAAEEEAEKFIRHYFPADMKYAYQINATDEPNRWEMLYEQIPQGMESTFTDDYYDAEEDFDRALMERKREAWQKLSPEEKMEWKAKWKNSGRPKGQRTQLSDLLSEEREQEILSAYQSGDYSKMDVVVDKYGWDTTTEALKKHKFGRYADDFKEAESPSATIPVKGSEPSWVKPMATALGFALGFFGIHEIKKVL